MSNWTTTYNNPFRAAWKAAPNDDVRKQIEAVVASVFDFDLVNADSLVGDLLESIASTTNVVVQETQPGCYRACVDENFSFTAAELKAHMLGFLAGLDDEREHEWYCTDRSRAKAELTQFAQQLGIYLETGNETPT